MATTTKRERERERKPKKKTNHFKLRLINDITVALSLKLYYNK